MPLLLVRLTGPCAAANQAAYPATGSTPASSEEPALRQPNRRSSRNSGTSRTSGRAVGRTVTETPVIRPAVTTCHVAGGLRNSRTPNAPTISAMASRSAMTNCSTRICAGSNTMQSQPQTNGRAKVLPES